MSNKTTEEAVSKEIFTVLFHCIDDPEGNDDDLAQELTDRIMKKIKPILEALTQKER